MNSKVFESKKNFPWTNTEPIRSKGTLKNTSDELSRVWKIYENRLQVTPISLIKKKQEFSSLILGSFIKYAMPCGSVNFHFPGIPVLLRIKHVFSLWKEPLSSCLEARWRDQKFKWNSEIRVKFRNLEIQPSLR